MIFAKFLHCPNVEKRTRGKKKEEIKWFSAFRIKETNGPESI